MYTKYHKNMTILHQNYIWMCQIIVKHPVRIHINSIKSKF